jgi:carbon monoxide dehydrogenase subunit G
MTPIVESIEIARRPEDVFAYVTDPSLFPEWQESVVSAHRVGGEPLAVGSRAVVRRRVGPRVVSSTEEVIELSPPRTFGFRGVGGMPVAAIVEGAIEPLDEGERSRVTLRFDVEARGLGRLLVPLVVRPQVRRQLPRNEQKLKDVLEGAA